MATAIEERKQNVRLSTISTSALLFAFFTLLILLARSHDEQQLSTVLDAARLVVVGEPTTMITPPILGVQEQPKHLHRRSLLLTDTDESKERERIEKIKSKLVPHQFDFIDDTQTLKPHQFLHLHHMKTGGTSMDHLIKCAMARLEDVKNWTLPYYEIHECQRYQFRNCLQNATYPCRQKLDEASIMSYCAPLKHLDLFGWTNNDSGGYDEEEHQHHQHHPLAALTVLRHPVERVWSMFRFEPRACYKCKELKEIYDLMDSNEVVKGFDSLCLAQLQNHEVTNLLTSDFPEDASDDEIVEEAIRNMKNFFTVIGLTERLQDTNELLGQVFPWLALEIKGSDTICKLPHDNTTPENNHCIKPMFKGDSSRHWDLPDHPDEETRKAIEAHNQLDLRLYEAAVQHFELQMRAAGMGDES